jgi:glycine/D-amino acid oxidase-like deaminating enzyme
MSLEIGVVGGGIFGVTAAVVLGRSRHSVTLFEEREELLRAASGVNQLRLHAGYHYPRSMETALASRDAVETFRAMYPAAVVGGEEHYYAIARRGSLTDGGGFLRFLDALGLEHRRAEPPFLRAESVDLCVAVPESLIDPAALLEQARSYLRDAGVRVLLRTRASAKLLERFDLIVLATYASLNELVGELGGTPQLYQFEVVEKLVVRPPESLRDRSIVVLDGPFMCIDPYGRRSGLSLMGHVVHAIHHANVGAAPEIPRDVEPFLNRGPVGPAKPTAFRRFVDAAVEFIPDVARLEHVASMYTVRTVLPGLDETDARPTLVARHGERVIALFSGKIGTCVRAAEEVAEIAAGRPGTVGLARPEAGSSDGRRAVS